MGLKLEIAELTSLVFEPNQVHKNTGGCIDAICRYFFTFSTFFSTKDNMCCIDTSLRMIKSP
jgi:hypothetical protein